MNVDSVLVDPPRKVDRVEPDEVANLHEGKPALCDQAADVPRRHTERGCDRIHVDEPREDRGVRDVQIRARSVGRYLRGRAALRS